MAEGAIVRRRAYAVEEDEQTDRKWSHDGLGALVAGAEHLSPVAHVNDTLREEDRIVVDHQEDVVQVLFPSLILPEVHANRTNWSQEFDP